jgi:hypothetical protein
MPRVKFTKEPTTVDVTVTAADLLSDEARRTLCALAKNSDPRLIKAVELVRAQYRCAAPAINSLPTAAYYVGAAKKLLSRKAKLPADVHKFHDHIAQALERYDADLTDPASIRQAARRVLKEYKPRTTKGRPKGLEKNQALIETLKQLRQQFWKWYGGSPYYREGGGDTPERRKKRGSLARHKRGAIQLHSEAERIEHKFIELALPNAAVDRTSDVRRLLRDPRCSAWERLRRRHETVTRIAQGVLVRGKEIDTLPRASKATLRSARAIQKIHSRAVELAGLPRAKYAQVREHEAATLKVSLEALDKQVAAIREALTAGDRSQPTPQKT